MDKKLLSELALATVLMPVYNAEKYLNEAIDSILNQTFTNFKFLIINDGSSDKSENIILSYNDTRIIYLKNDTNLGVTKTLNKGIDFIKTKYIIRMDADDISLPDRFEKQITFMENNPEIGVSSGHLKLFGKENNIRKVPLSNTEIKAFMLFLPGIAHAVSIMRTSILKKYDIRYSSEFLYMEDYRLWLDLRDKTKFANLDVILYEYRREGQNLTLSNQTYQQTLKTLFRIYDKILTDFKIVFAEEDLILHYGFTDPDFKISILNLKKYKQWLEKLDNHNLKTKKYPQKELSELLNSKWHQVFYMCINKSLYLVLLYWFVSRKVKLNQIMYLMKIYLKRYSKKDNSL